MSGPDTEMMDRQAPVFLDGPVGTELEARGIETTLPLWSASAIRDAPEVLAAIHADYARAGAVVHTTNTFRTTRRVLGDEYRSYLRDAVAIARDAIHPGHRLAGSIAPLEDCYRPDDSPLAKGESPGSVIAEHREKAEALAEEGCDVLLCETFPRLDEARLALRAARKTGLPAWVSICPGPDGALLSAAEVKEAARILQGEGAEAILVNCVSSARALGFVKAIAEVCALPIGAYANAGEPNPQSGWTSATSFAPEEALAHARDWQAAGASIFGACCGMTPDHLRALVRGVKV